MYSVILIRAHLAIVEKGTNITYSECVSVSNMQSACAALHCHLSPTSAVPYSDMLSHKWCDFLKKMLLNIKCLLTALSKPAFNSPMNM
jgi:hypothetical protein